jgi:phosphate transport system permease protein
MLTCTLFTIIITIFIVATIFIETLQFFQTIPLISFVFGSNWDPQNEIPEYVTSSFGVIPLFAGTFLITIIAILTSAPIGILSSIYLTEYSTKKFRLFIKPLLEVLAGIPTVVYGYFAAIIVAPTIREIGIYFSLDISSESALAAGIVMGIMIVPYILSLSDDVINAVPQTIRDASFALGATKAETTIRIVLPAAKHGIYGSLLLAVSRAIGETMIVTMAAGLRANMSFNPLESTTTVTAQIVSLLSGDQESLAVFALAMVLFILTFILNIFAQIIVGNNKNKYE